MLYCYFFQTRPSRKHESESVVRQSWQNGDKSQSEETDGKKVAAEDDIIIQWKTKFHEDEERRRLGEKEYRAKKAKQRKEKIDKLLEPIYQEEERRMKLSKQSRDNLDQIADHARAWR
jgi:hypothetical protein